jgi:phosphate starvation-inducible protein PhoH
MEELEEFGLVEFTMEDCVRSGLVKNYLMAKERLKL